MKLIKIYFETGHEPAEVIGVSSNDAFFNSDGNDFSEVGSCTCNCKGECQPKSCHGASGRSISSNSLEGLLIVWF